MIDNESGEDYLEAVLQLASSEREVHSVDVARKLGVSKPAVTKAMKILRAKGYVEVENNHIVLTDEGREYAQAVYEKHKNIAAFLCALGVNEETAEADACQMCIRDRDIIISNRYCARQRLLSRAENAKIILN